MDKWIRRATDPTKENKELNLRIQSKSEKPSRRNLRDWGKERARQRTPRQDWWRGGEGKGGKGRTGKDEVGVRRTSKDGSLGMTEKIETLNSRVSHTHLYPHGAAVEGRQGRQAAWSNHIGWARRKENQDQTSRTQKNLICSLRFKCQSQTWKGRRMMSLRKEGGNQGNVVKGVEWRKAGIKISAWESQLRCI